LRTITEKSKKRKKRVHPRENPGYAHAEIGSTDLLVFLFGSKSKSVSDLLHSGACFESTPAILIR